jgi:hypothetical protein
MYPKGYEIVASWEVPTDGNAVPYKRMTQAEARMRNKPGVLRYLKWQAMIAESALPHKFDRAPKEKVYLYVHAYFRDGRHGDPDNVFKGIADSIYGQDKYVAGCVDFGYDRDNPRVVITILEREKEG